MIIDVRKIAALFRYIVIFLILTFLFYYLISWTIDFFKPRYQYKKPYGKSIEVNVNGIQQPDQMDVRERLYYFLLTGE